ncbi:hypothetical protein [Frigoriflavimonas asaccharolytica]|uniref:Lipoprotein n=1 Tax=Frigoriflavimonas asaccharolytica TaxID=2735899 RepID=A0A8J8G7S6_9FLAO|nr:hypothetical protein [Frigoriflavimonas asaccharolytica]NRS92738.1 hypothetical protein [Frigoriflavimonas asaccharolytica]
MNLEKLVIYLFSFWMILSCSSNKTNTNELIGKKFTAKTENRRLEIKIIDTEDLEITNEFFCTNIDEKYRKIVFKKKYHRIQNSIILTDSIFNFNLPYFNNSNCLFLSEKYRSTKDRKIFDGRTMNSNQEELYSIWNIDTLKIIENKLIYLKKLKRGSKGYLFE